MLDIEYCRKILESEGKKYTDEEIIEIRKLLYKFAKMQIKDLENGWYENLNKKTRVKNSMRSNS